MNSTVILYNLTRLASTPLVVVNAKSGIFYNIYMGGT